MAFSSAETWFIAGTIPFMAAGGLHVMLTLVDTLRPTFFTPDQDSTRLALERSGVRLRRMFPGVGRPSESGWSMWRAWLGFNISHGLGAFVFGLLCLVIALHDFRLVVEIPTIRPLTIAVATIYFALSLRFWFYAPSLAIGAGAACFVVAAALS